ncbi:hypothetical protein SAMN05216184_11711 [Georgenia satyanarayanai]|uniref:Uncharacterized protein n=1 Tax=Georgenia satyanarayanai TaxID=860221 RepID=A0A2Y9AW69_9MICO|nr:hypothetical protein [Georgenia satyanarayanai]PYF96793.1 hypothetical protein A8987_11711 [Georgenia satyanarayanai]SSA46389.1 hypothetical protein SAMN05216184_11711 [Georgenia satyanarayanai]
MAPESTRSGAVGVILPEDWFAIPLTDDTARTRAVAALVERQLDGTHAGPALRRDLHDQLKSQTAAARHAGGWLMAISLMRVRGAPVPASLVCAREGGAGLPGRTLEEIFDDLSREGGPTATVDAARGPWSTVVRRVVEPADGSSDSTQTPQLTATYYLDPGDGHGVIVLAFASPALDLRDGLLKLFDTVAMGVQRLSDGG